ncbi:MAG TPA: hypothetical protein VGL51_16960 [Solirubrobacteraceae bacterium]
MSSPGAGDGAARRVGAGAGRVSRAWRQLPSERRLAAGAALGLFVTLFLPWYQDTVIAGGSTKAAGLRLASASITGWGAFSFVEAAILLVAAGVLVLLFIRAEGGAFHVPGGDGGVVTAAGVWACFLILWRIFDKEGGHSNHGQYLTSTGIEWGIFIALAVAGLLTYAGSRIKLAHEPEPPLPGESPRPSRRGRRRAETEVGGRLRGLAEEAPTAWVTPDAAPAQRVRSDEAPAERVRADEAPTQRVRVDEAPTQRVAADEAPTQRVRPDQAPTQRVRADQAPTQRVRADEAPTRRVAADEAPTQAGPPDEAPTQRVRPEQRQSRRPVQFPSMSEIDFEDPPTARLGRSAPGTRRPDGSPSGGSGGAADSAAAESDEHLTIPLDQRSD